MTKAATIRLGRQGDIDELVSLLAEQHAIASPKVPFSERSVRISLAAYMSYQESAVIVALLEGAVVGMVALELARSWANFDHREARGHMLLVRETARGHGIGKALATAAEIWSKSQRAVGLILGVDVGIGLASHESLCTGAGFVQNEVWFRKELR